MCANGCRYSDTILAADTILSIAHLVQKDVSSENMEYFHEYLRKMTNKFTQNIYYTKDDTYRNLRHLIQNNDTVLLAGDFGCCYEEKRLHLESR